jgi:hypothetical protein
MPDIIDVDIYDDEISSERPLIPEAEVKNLGKRLVMSRIGQLLHPFNGLIGNLA